MAQFTEVGTIAVVKNLSGFLGDMGKIDSSVQDTTSGVEKSGSRIGKLGSAFANVGKVAVAGMATAAVAVAGIGIASLKTAVEFQSAWAGVVKTTKGLEDEFGNLTAAGEEMQQGFRDMAKEVPVAVEELMEIGELGGQLGVTGDDLLDFTEVIAAMGVSTNLTTEAAATGFAQLANVMGTTEQFGSAAFSRLGSSIVALGNTSATTESDILSFAQRIAGASEVAGVTEADMLGISAAFTSVGIQAQAGGTAVSKVFLDMNKAALEGGEKMEIFAAVAGMEADKFGAAWEEDAGAVFGEFVTGLGLAGDDAISILDALEIKDSQAVRAFLSLAGAGDLVTESMLTANKGWDENTALAEEAETRYKTTESQMILLKNSLKDVAITIGAALLPFLNDLIQAARPLIENLGKALPKFLDGSLIPALKNLGKIMSSVVDVIIGLIKGTVGIDTPFEDFFPPGLDKIAQKVVRAIVPIVDFLKAEIPKAIKSASKFFTGTLIPAFKQVGKFILSTVVPALTKFIKAVISFVQEHGPAIRNAIIAIAAVFAGAGIAATIAGIIASIIALFNPITLIIGAIALLAAAWTENWGGIRDIVTEVWENFLKPTLIGLAMFVKDTLIPAFVEFVSFLVATLGPVVAQIFGTIQEVVAGLIAWVQENWPAIKEAIISVIIAVQNAVSTALGAIKTFWEENGESIKATVSQVWGNIQTIITTAINLIKAIIQAVMLALDGEWAAAWETIKTALTAAWEAMKPLVRQAISAIRTTIQTIMTMIKNLWDTAWTAIETKATEVVEGLKTVVKAGFELIKAIIKTAMTTIKVATSSAWTAIKTIFSQGVNAIKTTLTNAKEALKAAGEAIVNAVKQGISAAWDGLVSWFGDRLSDLTDMLPFSDPKDATSPLRGLDKAGQAIVHNIQSGIADAMPALQAQLNAAVTPMQSTPPVVAGGSTVTTTNITNVEVNPMLASEPDEMTMFNDVTAALVAART